MDETLFGWIHLSDIHFGHGDTSHGWDQKLVMEALRRDIASKPAPMRVDAIFVTGDIAFSGAGRSEHEYDDARAWLLRAGEAAGVRPDSIFLVPGNHDVNRNVDGKNKSVGRLVDALRSPGTPKQSLDDALKDTEDRKLLASRMKGYLDLAKDFGPWAGREPLPAEAERLYWVCSIERPGGLRVRLVGLNTALLCRGDDDPGQLRLGNEQLARALAAERAPNEVILVLSHHPLHKGWLGDEGNANAWIRSNAQAHLSGHVHEAESQDEHSGSGGHFVRVTAGAAHNEQLPAWIPATHGYNLGEVRRDAEGKVVLRVHPQLWSPQNRSFRLDVHSVPRGATFADHEIRVSLPAATAAPTVVTRAVTAPPVSVPAGRATPAPAPLPAGPLPAFISYAPADAKAFERLRVHLSQLKRDRLIDAWSAAEVGVGEEAKKVAMERLQGARVVLLLLSPDYVASEDCYDVEMTAAVERHERGEALVIPVLLKACDYKRAPFKDLLFALQSHHLAEPVPVYQGEIDPEVAFARIADGVRSAVDKLRAQPARA